YYLTRAESSILDRVADQVVGRFSPESMVEIGAGSCTKTRVLIEAAMKRRLSCFVPFDISEATLQATARRLATDFPGLTVYAMVRDYAVHLDRVPRVGRQLMLFLASTLRNFIIADRHGFLTGVRRLPS